MFGMDKVINLSEHGASPDRQIRVAIEWIAQNGKPDMIIVPVTHYNRFDLPIAKKFHHLNNLHYRSSWQMDLSKKIGSARPINPIIDPDVLQTYLKTGAMVHQVEHMIHDYLFVKLITFQAFLELNDIKHLIFDTGNHYEKLWMKYLSIDEENNSGYQPGMKKRDMIENCKGIYKFLSFSSNVWMYENLSETEKKNYVPWSKPQRNKPMAYPQDENGKATIHHNKEQVYKLIKYLKKEGAVYG